MKKLPSIMRIQIFFLLLSLFPLILPSVSYAETQNNSVRQHVIDSVEEFVYRNLASFDQAALKVHVSNIDPRIQIPACTEEFVYSASHDALQQSNFAVKASCPANNWYLYVMVRTVVIQPVVVLKTMVSPGTILTDAHVEVVDIDKKQLRFTTFADKENVIGARIKRRSRAGAPVSPDLLCYVCKGDQVVIKADAAGLVLKTQGIAEEDGVVGETIRIRNSRSNKQVYGRVTNPTEVVVSI
ncbi:flagellar basal body P-ring formation chaperone FlgA [Aestuariibacter sp. AA17]|uniref:Flagella basal body P-ring formation protein FlgA n=1 Tax=Fluctibacter corallii TaxID=2984329 RepID=A0ABT3A9Y9_9ALTE|nr:flagellar basal body P-ring formation chaperone FlgA [Aestuariibacter sp. AA17]MCV2885491.1 flagellar basal body P-ring formation chaperone FlgA [Aestuariibacter sp. AA17]